MSEQKLTENTEQNHISYGTEYHLVHCGLCGFDEVTSTEVQTTNMVCRCGAEIVFIKDKLGCITVTTTWRED